MYLKKKPRCYCKLILNFKAGVLNSTSSGKRCFTGVSSLGIVLTSREDVGVIKFSVVESQAPKQNNSLSTRCGGEPPPGRRNDVPTQVYLRPAPAIFRVINIHVPRKLAKAIITSASLVSLAEKYIDIFTNSGHPKES